MRACSALICLTGIPSPVSEYWKLTTDPACTEASYLPFPSQLFLPLLIHRLSLHLQLAEDSRAEPIPKDEPPSLWFFQQSL